MKYRGTITFTSKWSLFFFKVARHLSRIAFILAVLVTVSYVPSFDLDRPETLIYAAPALVLIGIWLLLKMLVNRRIKYSMLSEAKQLGQPFKQYKKAMKQQGKRTHLYVVPKSGTRTLRTSAPKRHQLVDFKSSRQLKMYKFLRKSGKLIIIFAAIVTLMTAIPLLGTGSMIAPYGIGYAVLFSIGGLLIGASELIIRPLLKGQAHEMGVSVRKFLKEQLERHDARELQWMRINQIVGQEQKMRSLRDYSPEDYKRSKLYLQRTQAETQEKIDASSRHYAFTEYARRNGIRDVYSVQTSFRKEDGWGPVTKAIKDLEAGVHHEHKAYFEDDFHTWKRTYKEGEQGKLERI